MQVKREDKKAKLLQYAERVWDITSGSDDARIDAAIQKTVEFFESVGIKTRLKDYQVDSTIIPKIVERFEKRGTRLGEKGDLMPQDVARVLELQL